MMFLFMVWPLCVSEATAAATTTTTNLHLQSDGKTNITASMIQKMARLKQQARRRALKRTDSSGDNHDYDDNNNNNKPAR